MVLFIISWPVASCLIGGKLWPNSTMSYNYKNRELLCSTRTPEEITKQKSRVRRTKGFYLGDFFGGFCWTKYRTSVAFIFIPWFLESISLWGTVYSCFHIAIYLRVFTSNLLCLNVYLNCLSLDNHLVSKPPQWQCHVTMAWQWGHVTKQILNLAGWREDQNE